MPLSVLVIYKYSTSTTDVVIEDSISEEVIQMGKALIEEDYETYTQFTHPIIIESMGGKQKLIDLLVSTKTQMLSEGSRIINIEPGQILDVKNNGK